MQGLLSKALDKKINLNLKEVSKACLNLRQSNEVKLFEEQYVNRMRISNRLNAVRYQTDLIRYTIQDIKDWTAMNQGNLKKLNIDFSLMNTLNEIYRFANIQVGA
jgi:hypothetical protein